VPSSGELEGEWSATLRTASSQASADVAAADSGDESDDDHDTAEFALHEQQLALE